MDDNKNLECVFCDQKISIEDGKVINHKIDDNPQIITCPISEMKVETYEILLENYILWLKYF